MKYHHLKNTFFGSNTFIVEGIRKKVVVVDPGEPDAKSLISRLVDNNWIIVGVILTHEHIDHIAGLARLSKVGDFPVCCSEITSFNIGDCRENFSKYIDGIDPCELDMPTQIMRDNQLVKLGGMEFRFIDTPGHSPGGACIFTSDAVFTGDTILNEVAVPLNFPHSNKHQYLMSLKKITTCMKEGMTIFPGHGKPFEYKP